MNFNSALQNQPGFSVKKDDRVWDSKALRSLAGQLCEDLLNAGVQTGEKILLKAANGPEHFIVFLACEKMRLLYVPVYHEVTAREYEAIVAELGFCREVTFDTHTVHFEIKTHTENEKSGVPQRLQGCLFKTSGTTSSQKYIFHSFENMWLNAGIASAGQQITASSKILSLLTYSHMGGFCMQALPALRAGATVLIEEKSHYAAVAEKLAQVSHSVIVPSAFRYLNEFCQKRNLKFLNRPLVVTGSVPVSNLVLQQMLTLGFRVQVIYGLTEMGPYVCRYEVSSPADLKSKEYFLGLPLPGYNAELAPDSGEILLSGPCKGSVYDPRGGECEPLPHLGPAIRTGDAGTADGSNLYFAGRLTLTINVGGFKVSPQEIENVILSVSGVEACVVKGEKHFALGEVPVAYVRSSSPNLDSINKKIHESLARYKWPRKINFVDKLPETSIGKTKRNF